MDQTTIRFAGNYRKPRRTQSSLENQRIIKVYWTTERAIPVTVPVNEVIVFPEYPARYAENITRSFGLAANSRLIRFNYYAVDSFPWTAREWIRII